MFAFFDEAGRSGKQYYANNKWNFQEQPYFGLGTIIVPCDKYQSLTNEIKLLIDSEKFQGEFKWSNKLLAHRVARLLPEFYRKIVANNCEIMIELEDKRFTFVKLITEYCVLPYYDSPNKTERFKLCRLIATYLYNYLKPEILSDICTFFDECSMDTDRLKEYIALIRDSVSQNFIKECCTETIDTITQFEEGKLPLTIENLFPIPNINTGGKSQTCITPQIDCFNNMLSRINRAYPQASFCKCIHDNIKELSDSLLHEVKVFPKACPTMTHFSIDFIDSKNEILIRVIDYIVGAVLDTAKKLIDGRISFNEMNECEKNIITNNTNFVSSFQKQSILFPDNAQLKLELSMYNDFLVYN